MSENQKLREVLQAISHIDDTTNHSVDASAALDRIGQIARQALALPTADHLPDAGEMVEAAAPVGELPELPEPFALSVSVHDGEHCKWPLVECMLYQKHPNEKQKLYTDDQMRAYARAALSAGDALDAARYRWLADCNNYEAGLALIIDPKLTEQALGAAIDAAILARGEVDPLTRYRVWPDGTVQEESEPPYTWMSDDFTYVDAVNEEQAHKLANEGLRATQHALEGEAEA